MKSTAYILITLVAFLLGQWLVTRKHWSGFLVWCAANVYSIVTCILTDMPQTSLLFAAYFIVNFVSLRSWFTKSRGASPEGAKPMLAPATRKKLLSQVVALLPAPKGIQPRTKQAFAVGGA